jgi:hypothetical protein
VLGKIRELGQALQAVPLAVIKIQSSVFSKLEKTCRPVDTPFYCSTVGRTEGTRQPIPVSGTLGRHDVAKISVKRTNINMAVLVRDASMAPQNIVMRLYVQRAPRFEH